MPAPSLLPIFGTYCRTEGFAHKFPDAGTAQYTYVEAYRDRAQADSWTVRRVVQTANQHSQRSFQNVENLHQRVSFTEALSLLAKHESHYSNSTLAYAPLFPGAAAMGFTHFRAFAEREGYVFDVNGKAHPRPAADLLPADATFTQDDIANADKNLQRPASEFDPAAPSRRLPDSLFIFDAFNRKAIGKHQGNEIAGLRVLNLLDTFINRIENMNTALALYAAAHLRTDSEKHVNAAESALVQARAQLRQIAAYGIDVRHFDKMADECEIVIHVMHAQGLYDQLRRSPHTFDAVEAQFKARATKAMETYATLVKKDPQNHKSDDGYTALQEMIIQGGTPALPGTIADFVARYRQQRSLMIAPIASKEKPGPLPPKP